MRRNGLLARVLGIVAALTMAGGAACAEDLSPNGQRADDAISGISGDHRFWNSLSGETYVSLMLGSISIQRQFRSVLPPMHSDSRTAPHIQNSADSDAAYASAAGVAAQPAGMCAPDSKWVMWSAPFMMDETRKRDQGYLGYRNRASGFAAGLTRMLGETGAVGLALGYDARKLDARDSYHMRHSGNAFHAALYGGTAIGHFFVDAYAGYSHAWNRSERDVEWHGDTPDARDLTKGNHTDTVLSAGLKASHVWILDNGIRITPSVGLDYSRVRMKGFQEKVHSGQSFIALSVETSTYQNLSMPILVSANRTFAGDFLTFGGAPSLWTRVVRGGWFPLLGASHAGAHAQLKSHPGSVPYRINSNPRVRSYGMVGAGLKLKLADRFIFAVDYDYSFAPKYAAHSLTATCGVSF